MEGVTYIAGAMTGLRIVLDAKAAFLLGSTVRTEGKGVIDPETVPVFRMITGVILRTSAHTADTGDGFRHPLIDILDIVGISVKHQIHQLRLGGRGDIQDKHALPGTGHVTGLGMGGATAWKKENAGVGIGHRGKMLAETFLGLLVLKHRLKIGRSEGILLVGRLQVTATGDAFPHVAVVAPLGMTKVIDLMATLSQLLYQSLLGHILPAACYIDS